MAATHGGLDSRVVVEQSWVWCQQRGVNTCSSRCELSFLPTTSCDATEHTRIPLPSQSHVTVAPPLAHVSPGPIPPRRLYRPHTHSPPTAC